MLFVARLSSDTPNMMSATKKWKHRRKLKNFIIDRASFLRLSTPFLLMASTSSAIVFAMRWEMLHELEKIKVVGAENLPVINGIHDLQVTVTTIGTAGMVLLSVTCFGLWVMSSHKVFGPTVPLRRHIRNLAKGEYSSRVQLRGGDEFQDLGADLNQLAESLDQKIHIRIKAS